MGSRTFMDQRITGGSGYQVWILPRKTRNWVSDLIRYLAVLVKDIIIDISVVFTVLTILILLT